MLWYFPIMQMNQLPRHRLSKAQLVDFQPPHVNVGLGMTSALRAWGGFDTPSHYNLMSE